MNSNVAAVVVAYRPDREKLVALIDGISPQVHSVVVADNGGTDWLEAELATSCRRNVSRIDMHGNQGIGRALNKAFLQLQSIGISWVITFDQDSWPPPDLVARLYAAAASLDAAGVRCAAVGPAFYDGREAEAHVHPFFRLQGLRVRRVYPRAGDDGPIACDALITSGMLVQVRAWAASGGFHEGMFVDYTDTEWCFRVRASEWSMYGVPSVRMRHELSDRPAKSRFGLILLAYSPLRHYFYVRNTLYVATRKFTAPVYRARLLAGMLLRLPIWLFLEPNRWGTFRATVHGVADWLSGRLGPARTTRY